MSSQFYFPPYGGNTTFQKYDVVYGDGGSNTTTYYYSTCDNNIGNAPTITYDVPVTSYIRRDDLTTLYYDPAGRPAFFPGSCVLVTGITVNSTVNYTGMVSSAGSGSISFVNPGWDDGAAITVGAIHCNLNPCWTTGFFWTPSYSTKADIDNMTLVAKLGDGYSQRMPAGINTFNKTYDLVFQSRSNREIRGLINYVQDKAGAQSFQMMIPISLLENQTLQKWIASSLSYTNDSFNLNTATVKIMRVFEP
jgi:phage-related protein